ncbi:MAG: hypothetical protein IT239_00775 [Bacteroidia bacterium]|nr:hypothetical protein [Bacteroidia bacterium]
MADRSLLKENLRYLRFVIYAVILCYIWIQYNFSSGNWSYSNGQPKVDGQRLNGKDEGTWTWFYDNGKKRMQGKFNQGKRIGIWIIWDINENKISETNYFNDKLNGNFTRWYANGTKESEGIYQDDILKQAVYYNPDGTKK